ncbi:hypothetical protein RAS1_40200 [Phycisphaerae bacterium RAS1]|nr:hypothetical protein RAS1_40200 [Phycisphaerae bacterium RAS1]
MILSPTPSNIAAGAALAARIADARRRLDEHTREIVAWHFDPASGAPFWIDFANRLGWDPRREIQGYDDLDRFPPFQDEWLRGGPVRRWVPRGLAGRPVCVFETGGSTGVPKSRINIDDFRIDYEMFSETLDDAFFPRGSDWLMLGPSGPRRLRLAVEHLAQHRGGICFGLDLDPRWVTKLIKSGRMDLMHEYKDHVISQALTILRAHDNIRCLFATPKLLEALCDKISIVKAGITGVFCGGTSMTAQFYRFACEELLEGGAHWWKPGKKKIDFAATYGNTLMGLATHKPFDPADNYSIIYHPPQPRAVIEIVDPASSQEAGAWHAAPAPGSRGVRHRVVEYGQSGRVRLTTLTREFFMPRFLERDEAVRHAPCERYPWDGAGDVRPFSGFATPIVEGVY